MIRYCLAFSLLAGLFSSCTRNYDEVWDDTKSASRHIQRGFYAMGGKHEPGRQVRSREDFMPGEPPMWTRSREPDFIPVPGEESGFEIAMCQSPFAPGEAGSRVPGIDAFVDPTLDVRYSHVFKTVYFPYDSNYLQGGEQLSSLRNIAAYLRQHPDTFIFVSGHCDERGSESYNFSLGSRRASTVRSFLIKEGVDEGQIFTISYGKERPFSNGKGEDAWAKNRRVEFKVYEQENPNTVHYGKRSIPNAGSLSASW